MADLTIQLAGETVHLLPERALYWPRRKTVFVADLHLGKAATFRAAAIPIPSGTTQSDLFRLSQLLKRTQAERLVILGDLIHARTGRSNQVLDAVTAWRGQTADLTIQLVLGNHDEGAGSPPESWGIEVIEGDWQEPPFVGCHYPHVHPAGHVLAGHLHPMIRLRGQGDQSARLPCFQCQEQVTVLPAFSSFVGGVGIQPGEHDRIYGIVGETVFACEFREPRASRSRRSPSSARKSSA